MATRTKAALCFVEYSTGVITLIPCNSLGNDELAAAYTGESDSDGVTITATDAGRDGYGQSGQPYKNLVFTVTTS